MDILQALAARDLLLDIAARWGELRARLVPGGGAADTVRTAPTSRPPLDEGVSAYLGEVEWWARFYAQVLTEETDWTPSTSTMPGLLQEVARRYGHFTTDEDERLALDFCDTATRLHATMRGILERPEPPRWAGPCPMPECDGGLYHRAERTYAHCRQCGTTIDGPEWREMMAAAFDGRLMTRSELVSALLVAGRPVRIRTLDQWVTRGRLPVALDVGPGEARLYRFADAYQLAERYDVTVPMGA